MPTIVAVHGIAQQVKGAETLHSTWLPAMRDGLKLAKCRRIGDDELVCAFYGDLFRKKGTRAVGPPPLDVSDVKSNLEKGLLELWWREAARIDPTIPGPEAKTRVRTPTIVQRAMNNLLKSKFFAKVSERALVWDLKQVAAYLDNADMRTKIRERVVESVGADTRVVVGHSLGSVVAYEVLCANAAWKVKTFVSLGSPLGIANIVFHKLTPSPTEGLGAWPNVEQWFNIADAGDVVAMEKKLATRFGTGVHDVLVNNESKAHDVLPYLTAKETGVAIASGLA